LKGAFGIGIDLGSPLETWVGIFLTCVRDIGISKHGYRKSVYM
jgi:hypothetical protein